MHRYLTLALLLLSLVGPSALVGQTPEGVRLGLLYQPEYQPGLVVLPFAGGGSAAAIHAIIHQDLDFSDRFQLREPTGATPGQPANVALWKERGADWVVEGTVTPRTGGVTLNLVLHDAVFGQKKAEQPFNLPAVGDPNFRMAVHSVADELVRWVTGEPGAAATRIAFVLEGRGSKEIYVVDFDGENVQRVTSDGSTALSPAWSPDGARMAYTSFRSGRAVLYERDLRTGRDRVLSERAGINITPAYSPDGRMLALGATVNGNTEIGTFDLGQGGSTSASFQPRTQGRRFDSLSPTFSPDGRQIAFVSNRLGQPHIFMMTLGGEARVISEHPGGQRAYNTSPDWSPRGSQIVYQSRVNGRHQIMLYDVNRGTRRLLTNEGENEDPSWAPDGRHVVFASRDRDGGGLFVLDTVSGRVRTLLRGSGYGLPAWSGTLWHATSGAVR
jgi:TolB protein